MDPPWDGASTVFHWYLLGVKNTRFPGTLGGFFARGGQKLGPGGDHFLFRAPNPTAVGQLSLGLVLQKGKAFKFSPGTPGDPYSDIWRNTRMLGQARKTIIFGEGAQRCLATHGGVSLRISPICCVGRFSTPGGGTLTSPCLGCAPPVCGSLRGPSIGGPRGALSRRWGLLPPGLVLRPF